MPSTAPVRRIQGSWQGWVGTIKRNKHDFVPAGLMLGHSSGSARLRDQIGVSMSRAARRLIGGLVPTPMGDSARLPVATTRTDEHAPAQELVANSGTLIRSRKLTRYSQGSTDWCLVSSAAWA